MVNPSISSDSPTKIVKEIYDKNYRLALNKWVNLSHFTHL